MSKWLSVLGLLLAVTVSAAPAQACTSFRVKTAEGYVFYGRTLEGKSFGSSISIVPQGTQYVGTLPDGKQGGLKWTTKYGMLGMNAGGLPQLIDQFPACRPARHILLREVGILLDRLVHHSDHRVSDGLGLGCSFR